MKDTQVVLTNVRLSFVHLLKPYAAVPGAEEKYSVTMLLPKTDTATKAKLDAAIEAAKNWGREKKWGGVIPPICPTPIHDGDGVKQDGTAIGPECKGMWVMKAYSKADQPVDVVDRQVNKILNPTEIYSGMYANVAINVYPYLYAAKKGIGFGLGPVQKVADGESFGGSAPTAASVFTALGDAPQPAAAAPKINPLTGQPM